MAQNLILIPKQDNWGKLSFDDAIMFMIGTFSLDFVCALHMYIRWSLFESVADSENCKNIPYINYHDLKPTDLYYRFESKNK